VNSKLTVAEVHSKRDRQLFFRLPWHLYDGDPNWIPPLRSNQLGLLGFKRHPFYEQNEIQTFLATRDGRACGRVAAIVNHEHNRRYREQRGFFGFFESVDDAEVAAALFDAVRSWFAERDIVDIRGPMNPSMNHECGLLVDGFDSPPTFMMTYNPPYYAALLEQCGFRKVQDMYAFWGHVDMLKTLDKKLEFVVGEATRRFNVKLRRLDRSRFGEEVRMFLRIYNESLMNTWGFTPISESEIDHLSSDLKMLIVPELTSVAEVDGKPVAAAFSLLDYHPRIKQIDGRLFPLGFMRLLWNRRAIKKIRILSTNVVPEYQRWGLGLVILSRLVPEILDWGIEEAEFSWVLESNHLSYGTLKRGGAKITKTYRIYDFGPHVDPIVPS
jgi:GNAT superfamily N-acetyltransferase